MTTCSIPNVVSRALLIPATALLLAPVAGMGGTCDEFPCGRADQKVLICHAPPGNPANARTLCIEPDSAADHLADHPYDYCGPCKGGAVAAGQAGNLSADEGVGVIDLLLLLTEWGPCDAPETSAADLDLDTVVGAGDLLRLVVD